MSSTKTGRQKRLGSNLARLSPAQGDIRWLLRLADQHSSMPNRGAGEKKKLKPIILIDNFYRSHHHVYLREINRQGHFGHGDRTIWPGCHELKVISTNRQHSCKSKKSIVKNLYQSLKRGLYNYFLFFVVLVWFPNRNKPSNKKINWQMISKRLLINTRHMVQQIYRVSVIGQSIILSTMYFV